jgi:DNA-binding NarL/FixJ family response regulator
MSGAFERTVNLIFVGSRPSPAERAVLELLVDGRSRPEIALHLGVAPKTVDSVVARAIQRTSLPDTRRSFERRLLMTYAVELYKEQKWQEAMRG